MSETQLHSLQMLARRFRRYGLTQSWFREEAEAGRLPCFKVGKRFLFDPEAVERALLLRARRSPMGGEA